MTQTTFLPPSLIAQHRKHGLKTRTFFYAWCNRTETDYICQRCNTIAVDGLTCQHCQGEQAKRAASLRRFLDGREEGNT